MEGAYLQCVDNHYVKFEYKGTKNVGVTDYTNQTPSKHFGQKMSSSTPLKNEKIYSWNVHKIKGVHQQFVNNHYAKFE